MTPESITNQREMMNERRLLWADIHMKHDLYETGIAAASACHPYYLRDGITTHLLALLTRIGEGAK